MSVTTSRGSAWLLGALASAVLAGAILAGARLGALPLLIVVAALQALAIAGFLTTRPPSTRGVAVVALLTAAAADGLAAGLSTSLTPLAGVVGLSVLATVVVQLVRGVARARVTEAMASTLGLGMAVVALATLLVLRRRSGGEAIITVYALAGGVALLTAAGVDRVLPRPRVTAEVDHGWLAVVLGALVGVLVGAASARLSIPALTRPHGALLGGSAALVAVLMSLVAAFAAAESGPSRPWYAFLAGPLLAFIAAAPLAYLLGQLVVG